MELTIRIFWYSGLYLGALPRFDLRHSHGEYSAYSFLWKATPKLENKLPPYTFPFPFYFPFIFLSLFVTLPFSCFIYLFPSLVPFCFFLPFLFFYLPLVVFFPFSSLYTYVHKPFRTFLFQTHNTTADTIRKYMTVSQW
jgi:hypothetical protein